MYLKVYDACGQLVFKSIPWYVLQQKCISAKNTWNVVIYPNPAHNSIEVRTEDDDNIKQAQIYDICGKLIRTQDVGSHSIQIDVSNLATGMYFIRAISENETKIISFVKD